MNLLPVIVSNNAGSIMILRQSPIINFTAIVSQYERTLIQSVASIGSFFGLIIINYISDKKGKRTALIVSQLFGIFGIITCLLGAQYDSFPLMLLSQFFCGFAAIASIIVSYILIGQFSNEQFKPKAIVALNIAWALTFILIGILYFVYNEWYNFLMYIVLIPLAFIFTFSVFFLVQSPYFLYQNKRYVEYLRTMETISKYNNTLPQFQKYKRNFLMAFNDKAQLLNNKQNEHNEPQESVKLMSVIKNVKYLKLLIALTLMRMGISAYYFALNYVLSDLGFNYGINMVINGVIQILACLILNFLIVRLSRKKGIILFSVITIIAGLFFILQVVQNDNTWATVVLEVARFAETILYIYIMLVETQSFPISVRSICAGIVESLAQIGTFLGPIIVTICINLQVQTMIVISVMSLVTILIPSFILSQNKKQQAQSQAKLIENEEQSK